MASRPNLRPHRDAAGRLMILAEDSRESDDESETPPPDEESEEEVNSEEEEEEMSEDEVADLAADALQISTLFARHPSDIQTGIVDLTTKFGRKIYERAIAPLYDEGDKYNATDEGLHTMLALLGKRAREQRWTEGDGILLIPDSLVNPNSPRTNLLEGFATVTIEHLREVESVYIHGHSRKAQDTCWLYNCLFSSLTTKGKEKVLQYQDQYHIDGIESGVLFLKVLIREAYIDSRAKSTSIRYQLSNLSNYIEDVGFDLSLIHISEPTRLRRISYAVFCLK